MHLKSMSICHFYSKSGRSVNVVVEMVYKLFQLDHTGCSRMSASHFTSDHMGSLRECGTMCGYVGSCSA